MLVCGFGSLSWTAAFFFLGCFRPSSVTPPGAAGGPHYAVTQFLPTLAGLPADDAGRRRSEQLIRAQQAGQAVYVSLMWCFAHWIVLGNLGCNRYTVGSFAAVYGSLRAAVPTARPPNGPFVVISKPQPVPSPPPLCPTNPCTSRPPCPTTRLVQPPQSHAIFS